MQIDRDDTRKGEICCVSAEIDKHPNFGNLKSGLKKFDSQLWNHLYTWWKTSQVVKSVSCVPRKFIIICQVLATGPQKDFLGFRMMLNDMGFVVWMARETKHSNFRAPQNWLRNSKLISKCLLRLLQKYFRGF